MLFLWAGNSEECASENDLDLGDDQSQFMAAHGLCIQNKLHASVPFLAPEDMQDD